MLQLRAPSVKWAKIDNLAASTTEDNCLKILIHNWHGQNQCVNQLKYHSYVSVLTKAFASCFGHMWDMNCGNFTAGCQSSSLTMSTIKPEKTQYNVKNMYSNAIILHYTHYLLTPKSSTNTNNNKTSSQTFLTLVQSRSLFTHTHAVRKSQWAPLPPATGQYHAPMNPTWRIVTWTPLFF